MQKNIMPAPPNMIANIIAAAITVTTSPRHACARFPFTYSTKFISLHMWPVVLAIRFQRTHVLMTANIKTYWFLGLHVGPRDHVAAHAIDGRRWQCCRMDLFMPSQIQRKHIQRSSLNSATRRAN